MAYNQGFYNLFLALGTAAGLVMLAIPAVTQAGLGLTIFTLLSMLLASLVLITSNRVTRAGGDAAGRRAPRRADLPGAGDPHRLISPRLSFFRTSCCRSRWCRAESAEIPFGPHKLLKRRAVNGRAGWAFEPPHAPPPEARRGCGPARPRRVPPTRTRPRTRSAEPTPRRRTGRGRTAGTATPAARWHPRSRGIGSARNAIENRLPARETVCTTSAAVSAAETAEATVSAAASTRR